MFSIRTKYLVFSQNLEKERKGVPGFLLKNTSSQIIIIYCAEPCVPTSSLSVC